MTTLPPQLLHIEFQSCLPQPLSWIASSGLVTFHSATQPVSSTAVTSKPSPSRITSARGKQETGPHTPHTREVEQFARALEASEFARAFAGKGAPGRLNASPGGPWAPCRDPEFAAQDGSQRDLKLQFPVQCEPPAFARQINWSSKMELEPT